MNQRVRRLGIFLVASAAALTLPLLGVSAAQEPAEDGADRLIAEGRLVYEANCQGCHQADGAGISGVFPPLVGNSHVDDADYVASVVRQGREGEITVNGITYNAMMPAFGALSDDQVEAVVAFVQDGLGVAPPPSVEPPVADGEPAGTTLPVAAQWTSRLAFLVALAVIAIVVIPVMLARSESGRFSDAQAWLKSVAIVAYFAIATVVIPSWVIESEFLASPPSVYLDLFSAETWGVIRDLVGTALWLGALALGVWALRRAQRERVI